MSGSSADSLTVYSFSVLLYTFCSVHLSLTGVTCAGCHNIKRYRTEQPSGLCVYLSSHNNSHLLSVLVVKIKCLNLQSWEREGEGCGLLFFLACKPTRPIQAMPYCLIGNEKKSQGTRLEVGQLFIIRRTSSREPIPIPGCQQTGMSNLYFIVCIRAAMFWVHDDSHHV